MLTHLIRDEVGLCRRRFSLAPLVAAVQQVLKRADGGFSDRLQPVPGTGRRLSREVCVQHGVFGCDGSNGVIVVFVT